MKCLRRWWRWGRRRRLLRIKKYRVVVTVSIIATYFYSKLPTMNGIVLTICTGLILGIMRNAPIWKSNFIKEVLRDISRKDIS